MDLRETIYRMLKRGRSPESLPYEELHRRFAYDRDVVWAEFVRRLQRLVFHCAEESSRLYAPSAARSREEIEENTVRAFKEFYPEFNQGEPETLLLRFAQAIRRVLGDEAFKQIALRFYYHLPLYHIQEDQPRRFMAALFENGLATRPGKDFAADLADRIQVSVERAKAMLLKGQKQLRKIMEKDFSRKELQERTEGLLPDYGENE